MRIKKVETQGNYKKMVVIFVVSIISLLFTSPAMTEEAEMSWMTSIGGNVTMAAGDVFENTYVIGRGSSGVFLAKYGPLGNKLWTHSLQEDSLDTPTCLTVDAEGNCYVGGRTVGTVTLVGTENQTVTGTHAFVAKYSSNGVLLWIRLIGSAGSDNACRMVFDQSNNCYVTGNTSGNIDGEGDAAGTDPFVAKISPAGELIWISQLREASASSGLGIGVNRMGNVYIAGESPYIATYDSSGRLVQYHRLVGSFPSLQDIASDSLGNAYLCGWDGGYTGYVTKYSSDGSRQWEQRYRLNGWSCPKSIAAFADGSNDIITGGCQGAPSGGTDCEAFARRYEPDGNLVSIFASTRNLCGQHVGIDNVGGWYVISDEVVIKVEPPIYATAPLQFEAESAAIQGGAVETAQAGYSGSGYVHFNGDAEGRIEWNVPTRQPGTKTLIWRFKNITSKAIPIMLQVNGLGGSDDPVLESTAHMDDWMSLSAEVYLGAGNNTIGMSIPAAGELNLCLDSMEVIDADDSMAFGKSVVCSSEMEAYPAVAALDGKLASSWMVNEYPQWLEIDLDQEYPINQTKLTGRSTGACQFEIEAKSASEEAYRRIVDGRDNNTALATTSPVVSTFAGTPARYIKLTITGSADSGEVEIQEFGVSVVPQRPSISIGTEGYRTIQEAVEHIGIGSVIKLQPGLYAGNGNGNLQWYDKKFVLTSVDVNDPVIVAGTVIKGNGETPVLSISRTSQESMLLGLTVTGGLAGVHCLDASPRIEHCRIVENVGHGIEMQVKSDPTIRHTLIYANNGAGIMMTPQVAGRNHIYNEPHIINCTIAQNTLEGLINGRFSMRNCIVWGNGIETQGVQLSPVAATVSYSCIQGGFPGEGNIDTDPMFVAVGDYHLHLDSPCIDAGCPDDAVGEEPLPNGGRINMGAYGGTINATKTTANQ